MKTPITHSQPDADGVYTLRTGKHEFGQTWKHDGGFIAEVSLLGQKQVLTARTMKELKEQIATAYPDVLKQPERIVYPTIDQARRRAGLSHTEVRGYLDEIRHFHPEMNPRHQGGYMMRRTFENIRDFPELARALPWALRWLKENPKIGQYKPVSPEEWELQARRP
jgi:hypothetical protein